MVWTSKNGPKCPVSPEDRGEEPAQRSYPDTATHFGNILRDEAKRLRALADQLDPDTGPVAQTAQRPLAWRYELAGARFWNNDDTPGEYTNWVWRVSDSEPNAGDGMRNVTPLYALPSTDHK